VGKFYLDFILFISFTSIFSSEVGVQRVWYEDLRGFTSFKEEERRKKKKGGLRPSSFLNRVKTTSKKGRKMKDKRKKEGQHPQ